MNSILKYCFVLVFALLSSVAFSQQFKPQAYLGINGGLLYSQVDFLPSIKQNNFIKHNAGVTFRYISEKHVGLQVELNYKQKGWGEKLENNYFNRQLDYVELPLLTHVYFGQKQRFFINFGPQIAYLINDYVQTDLLEVKDINHYFDYGISGGLGFEWNTSNFSYLLEGRYGFGLGDIYNNGKGDDFSRSSNRNISINLVLLYHL